MRVGVLGAAGKMGRTACEAVSGEQDMCLAAAVDPSFGDIVIQDVTCTGDMGCLVEADVEVAVDFTRPDTVMDNIRYCVDHAVHVVVGTTGLGPRELDEIRSLVEGHHSNVFVAPNFSIGAVLMMHFAKQAAAHLGSCEIVELHHNQKLDAPSGTAWKTAQDIAAVWSAKGRPSGGEPAPGEQEKLPGSRGADVDGVRVHSVRLAGLVAHQEVVFGGPGQMLTLRHDSLDRWSFMPGVVLAVRSVASCPGLTVGLESLLDL
ncbi:MAG TPA: 4-hydroxy-tetrahydrodipicolinate reductase [Actinomycetota bacterium]|nr:4-hydroxy-tetrahydrodipicolinate reductase [Actinomycetota bacterium]